jgi:hypothetical protein
MARGELHAMEAIRVFDHEFAAVVFLGLGKK